MPEEPPLDEPPLLPGDEPFAPPGLFGVPAQTSALAIAPAVHLPFEQTLLEHSSPTDEQVAPAFFFGVQTNVDASQ